MIKIRFLVSLGVSVFVTMSLWKLFFNECLVFMHWQVMDENGQRTQAREDVRRSARRVSIKEQSSKRVTNKGSRTPEHSSEEKKKSRSKSEFLAFTYIFVAFSSSKSACDLLPFLVYFDSLICKIRSNLLFLK